jgi:hypothetical protein
LSFTFFTAASGAKAAHAHGPPVTVELEDAPAEEATREGSRSSGSSGSSVISAIISRSCGERADVLGKRAALVADGMKCDDDDGNDDDDEVVVDVDNICATAV